MSWSEHSLTSQERIFIRQFVDKLRIRMQGDPSCPSGIAMLNRAMYGTKDAAQCFDSYCERTMEKLDYNIGMFKSVFVQTSCQRRCDGLYHRLERRQIVLKSKLTQGHSELLIRKFWFANKQQRGEHTTQTYERQITHNQTFTTRFHIMPFQCHATRVFIS